MADQLNMNGLNLGPNGGAHTLQRSYIPPHMRGKVAANGSAPAPAAADAAPPANAAAPAAAPPAAAGPAAAGPAPTPAGAAAAGLNNSAWSGYVLLRRLRLRLRLRLFSVLCPLSL